MFQAWGSAFAEVSTPVLFYMIIAMVAGIYGSIALGGYNFTWQSAKPKAEIINPINGFKRMFGVEGLVELLKAIGKFIVIAGAALVNSVDFLISLEVQELRIIIKNSWIKYFIYIIIRKIYY